MKPLFSFLLSFLILSSLLLSVEAAKPAPQKKPIPNKTMMMGGKIMNHEDGSKEHQKMQKQKAAPKKSSGIVPKKKK